MRICKNLLSIKSWLNFKRATLLLPQLKIGDGKYWCYLLKKLEIFTALWYPIYYFRNLKIGKRRVEEKARHERRMMLQFSHE